VLEAVDEPFYEVTSAVDLPIKSSSTMLVGVLPIEERLSRVEEQLKQKRDETIVEAQAIVGVDQVAGLKRLIDSLESQLSYYHRLISDLEGNVNDLRSQVMELERRVREREKVRGVARERSGQRAKVMSKGARVSSGTRMDVIRGRRFGFTQMTVWRPENGYHDACQRQSARSRKP
jgi:hypothetical protein